MLVLNFLLYSTSRIVFCKPEIKAPLICASLCGFCVEQRRQLETKALFWEESKLVRESTLLLALFGKIKVFHSVPGVWFSAASTIYEGNVQRYHVVISNITQVSRAHLKKKKKRPYNIGAEDVRSRDKWPWFTFSTTLLCELEQVLDYFLPQFRHL